MIAYMEGYVDEDGFLDYNLLPEPLMTSYREFKAGKHLRPWLIELKAALGVSDEPESGGDGSSLLDAPPVITHSHPAI